MISAVKKNDLVELSLVSQNRFPGTGELLRNTLVRAGAKPDSLSETQINGKLIVSVYIRSRQQANTLNRKLIALKLKKVSVKTRRLRKKDWQERWKNDFYPFALTQTIDIVPIWRKSKYVARGRRTAIFIDTLTSFGSGLHETTRFMARLIERCRRDFETFFDIGTGTGILSLVALKCGAGKVNAIDIDRDCLKTAERNFKLNHCSPDRLRAADIARIKGKNEFDFVAANLVTDDLITAGKNIISFVKPGKYLAVSGISLENLVRFKNAFKRLPLRCIRIEKGKQWAAILYKRIPEKTVGKRI